MLVQEIKIIMKKAEDYKWFWQNTYNIAHKDKIIEAVATKADFETLKWFWEQISNSAHKGKIIDGVVTRADGETFRWFWPRTYDLAHQDRIIDGVVTRADSETLRWFWQNTYNSAHKDKIVEAVATKADFETLKWFWDKISNSVHKDKIIDGVVTRADGETLRWFWQRTYDSAHQDKIIHALNIDEVSNNRIIRKSEKLMVLSEENRVSNSFKFDVFISHASEDKESFVRELAVQLSNKGLKVWFDEFSLSLGDSLRRKIDYGLINSRYGVVVLSKNFFEKEWPQKELDGLVAREDGLDKVILPVWHGVTKEEVKSFSPILADRLAVSSNKGINHIVNEIVGVIERNPNR